MKKFTTILLLLSAICTFFPISAYAQEEPQKEIKYKAKITELLTGTCPERLNDEQEEYTCYFFTLQILDGDKAGQTVESIIRQSDDLKLPYLNYKTGQTVYIVETYVGEETAYYVKEPLRKAPLTILTVLFIIVVMLIGRLQGTSSLVGLALSFIILRLLVIPLMLSGTSPIIASLTGGTCILVTSVYLSHGFNKKTTLALIGTFLSLLLTALLAALYTTATRLTGYATDEATYLVQLLDQPLDMRGVLLASVIIGGIGLLDDITVSQVSTIFELHRANMQLGWKELFKRSMNVGRDHIASMVNTLVLAYTGSALPLIMLFIASGASFEEIINFELVTEEIVRTLVGSIGLVVAVPITSLLASIIISKHSASPHFKRYAA